MIGCLPMRPILRLLQRVSASLLPTCPSATSTACCCATIIAMALISFIFIWVFKSVRPGLYQPCPQLPAGASVRPAGSDELRTRTEIKNVNSVRFAMQAVKFEAGRQVEIYDEGGEVDQETRAVRSVQWRDTFHALQGRSPRLPVLPGSRLIARRTDGGRGRTDPRRSSGTPRTPRSSASSMRMEFQPKTPVSWSPSGRPRLFSKKLPTAAIQNWLPTG